MIKPSEKIRKLPNNVLVKEYTYIGSNCHLNNTEIGKFCSIASNVCSGLGKHPTSEFISTYPAFFSKNNSGCKMSFVKKQLYEEYNKITIGNDVWIGFGAILMDGITIGNGAIIGAGAIVTKNIPSYAIAVGTPAKVIKYRFNEDEINMLLDFKWWDKSIQWIIANAHFFETKIFFQMMKENNFIEKVSFIDKKEYIVDDYIDINYNLVFSKQFNSMYSQILSLPNNIIIYGNGTIGKTIQTLIPDKIIGYVDIADENNHPKNLKNMEYDKIIISVLGREEEIIKYLVEDLQINIDKIITLEL